MVATGQTVGSVINVQLLPGNRNWRHLFNRLLLASTYNTSRFLVQVLAPLVRWWSGELGLQRVTGGWRCVIRLSALIILGPQGRMICRAL